MDSYRTLLQQTLAASPHPDRTGTGRRSVFGASITHDLSKGFPVLTGKQVNWKAAVAEMLWFISGSSDVSELRSLGTNIWNEWELSDGTIGPGYGPQFRRIQYSQHLSYKAPRSSMVSRSPSKVYGLGTCGDTSSVSETHKAILMDAWLSVLNDVTPSRYIHEPWTEFAVFARDIVKAPGWACKLENPEAWQLSNKFRYATRQWAPDTVSWVKNTEFMANVENFSRVAGRGETRVREIDQLSNLVAGLKHDPFSSRHVISLWNPHDLDRMALPPCHGTVIQAFVRSNKYLDLLQHQRSADLFLGLPFNLVGYGFLCHVLALETGLKPGKLTINIGDAHIYDNHVTAVAQYLAQPVRLLPEIHLDKRRFDEYSLDNISLRGYSHGPVIKAPVSI